MPKVHILPADVISKIAAGEVIERPASVVKELVENSLDAGATSIELHLQDAGRGLIHLKDNGSGIAEDKMSKIFTPNFTTKTGGMGLGLAMVKSIVETFGGKIWFETAREKGTAFFVSLPEYKDIN